MAFKHLLIDNERVSWPLAIGLLAARKGGVRFHVNEGRRTMARQAELLREKGLYNRITNPSGAAWPSPTAPHIKVGRWDHALDLDNASAVIGFFRNVIGVTLLRTVTTENWHVELAPADKAQLVAWARKHARAVLGPPTLKFNTRSDEVKTYAVKLRALGFFKGKVYRRFGPKMRAAVKAFQRKHKLTVDGRIGPNTRKAIDAAYRRIK